MRWIKFITRRHTQRLNNCLTKFSAEEPGCAYIASFDNGVTYKRISWLSFDRRKSSYNDKNQIFNIASITKQFTAFSILLLEQEGKLSLDDSIIKVCSFHRDICWTCNVATSNSPHWWTSWLSGISWSREY